MTSAGRTVVCAVAGWLCGCAGTDVGNPVDLDFDLYDSREPASGAVRRAVSPGLLVTEAWVSVDRIRLRDAANCDGNAELEVPGPFAIDMLAPATPPALRGLELPSSAYCRFEFRWAPAAAAMPGAPADLVEAAIYLRGVRGDGTVFIVRSDRSDEMRLDARSGSFSIGEATMGLFVGFDVAVIFDGVELDTAVVGGDGDIVIDDENNVDLAAVIEDNLVAAARLFDDDDGDGELDETERGDAEVLAETP